MKENRANRGLSSPSAGSAPHRDAGGRDLDDSTFLRELGQRVRQLRAIRGMSRKVLAAHSGISERYIAQLESGRGNVSIMLLRRVARAIGSPLADLVYEARELSRDSLVVRDLLRRAPPDRLAAVKAVLMDESAVLPAVAAAPPPSRVALIGLRGAGKSTLGRLVADRFGWPFVELNKKIEAEAGFSITEIFALYGQDGYRRLEQACLGKVVAREGPVVLATGGGVVAEPLTYDLLLSAFFTVWVKASPAEHMARVREQGDLRPMANDRAAMDELVTILTSRETLYSRAAATVDTAGQSIEDSLGDLVEIIAGQFPGNVAGDAFARA